MGIFDPPGLTRPQAVAAFPSVARATSQLFASQAIGGGAGILTNGTPAVVADSAGPAVMLTQGKTAFGTTVQGSTGAVQLPNGNLLVIWSQFGTINGAAGGIVGAIYSLLGAVVAGPFQLWDDPLGVVDAGQPSLTVLADGRLFASFPQFVNSAAGISAPCSVQNGSAAGGATQVQVAPTGLAGDVVTVTSFFDYGGAAVGRRMYSYVNPGMYVVPDAGHGIPAGTTVTAVTGNQITLSVSPSSMPAAMGFYYPNPDGLAGNCYGMLGTVTGNSIAWGSLFTIPTGVTPGTGFDTPGYAQSIEPTPGTLIKPIVLSTDNTQWAPDDVVTWIVGTYSPGGAITWSTTATPLAAINSGGNISSFNEPSIVIDKSGGWHIAARSGGTHYGQTNAGGPGATPNNLSEQVQWDATVNPSGSYGANGGSGGGTWSAPGVMGSSGQNQSCLFKLSSGTILLASRGQAGRYLNNPTVNYNADPNMKVTAWVGMTGDINVAEQVNNQEGVAFTEISGQPGLIAMVYSVNVPTGTQVLLRFLSEGSQASPLGGYMAPSASVGSLRAIQARIDTLAVGPVGLNANASGRISGGNGQRPSLNRTVQNPTSFLLVDSPQYTDGHPSPEAFSLRTDVGAMFQNFDRRERDADGSPFTNGVMYLTRFWPDVDDFNWRYIYLRTGVAVPTVTHAWAVMLEGPYTALTELVASVDLLTVVTANASLKFDFGSAQNFANQYDKYLGLVFVGSAMPSLEGRVMTPAAAFEQPFLVGNDSGGTTYSAGPSGFVVPTGPSAAGAVFEPHFVLSSS